MTAAKKLTSRVSPAAHQSWQDYAESIGVSVSALIEALGLLGVDTVAAARSAEVETMARQVEAERRSRPHLKAS